MIRYFITGVQGFLGRYVASQLLSSGARVEILGIGRSPRSSSTFTHDVSWGRHRIAAPLPERVRSALASKRYGYFSHDLSSPSDLVVSLQEYRPHIVIHLASALRDDAPASLLASNVEGSLALFQAIAASGALPRKVVVCSTGGVYGIPERLPIDEDAVCRPIDLYSASKLAAEHFSRVVATGHGIPTVWVRLFNLLGPGQDERHICGRLAAQASAIAAGVAPPVLRIGRLDTTRDFLDVRDAATAIILIAEVGEVGCTYNVASGIERRMGTVLEIVLELSRLTGQVRTEPTELRVPDIPRHVASIARLERLGFSCQHSLTDGLNDSLAYYDRTVSLELQSQSVCRTSNSVKRDGGT